MTKFGETDNLIGEDFIYVLEKMIKRKFDMVVFNSKKPSDNILQEYKKQKATFVEIHKDKKWNNRTVVKSDLLRLEGGLIRHDFNKLANVIKAIIT